MSKTHGFSETNEYKIWCNMRTRCNNPNSTAWPDYGGRGVELNPRWDSFENFIADVGPRPSELHTLERRNNDGDYSPENCKWATRSEQARNRRVRRNRNITGVYNRGTYSNGFRRYAASIGVSVGVHKHLYQGPDFFEACCARKSAELRYWND